MITEIVVQNADGEYVATLRAGRWLSDVSGVAEWLNVFYPVGQAPLGSGAYDPAPLLSTALWAGRKLGLSIKEVIEEAEPEVENLVY